MGDGYPLFEWATDIKINETMENDKYENITVGRYIQVQHEGNIVNMEIKEGD